MVDFLKANWFECIVAVYILLGVLGPIVAKVSPKIGNGMAALGADVGKLLSLARPGYVPPALPTKPEDPK